MKRQITDEIGRLAFASMLTEVSATPKPGLVDRANNGAHRDMDFFTFVESAAALRSSFDEFAEAGRNINPVEGLLPALREIGIRAEEKMFKATKNVNTHKGMIFSLGLVAGAAGRIAAGGGALNAENISGTAGNICRGLSEKNTAI